MTALALSVMHVSCDVAISVLSTACKNVLLEAFFTTVSLADGMTVPDINSA